MASSVKISNANGKIVTIENNDSNMSDITLNGASITKKVDTLANMRAMNELPETVWCSGYHSKNDGAFGSHFYRLKGLKTTETDNGGTVIIVSVGGSNYVYELQYSGAVNVKWFGAKGDGIVDDTTAIQNAINTNHNVFIPNGTFMISTITLVEGSFIHGESIKNTILKANSSFPVVAVSLWKHNIHLCNLTIDGDNIASECLKLTQNFRSTFEKLILKNATIATLTLERDIYFSSFRNIIGTGSPRIININPTYNSAIEHAVVNDNTFEQIQCNNYTELGMYMKASAGNTFSNFNYEIAETTATSALTIDHCHNNKFISHWFEIGGSSSMKHIIYLNDSVASYYTRNNEFDNCYIVGGTSNPLYGIRLGLSTRTLVKNTTFVSVQNAIHSNLWDSLLESSSNTFATGVIPLSGISNSPQVVHEYVGTGILNISSNTANINIRATSSGFRYDDVIMILSTNLFSGISSYQTLLYSYKYADKFTVFHGGDALTGSQSITFSYVLKYIIKP